jgi:hypothetical protein
MTTRRTAIGAALAAASTLSAQIAAPSETQPPLDPALVKDFVAKSHADLDGIRALLKREPRLVTAAWDWGAGDWENGLNAASHMGRHDIAGLLLDAGARLDAPAIFMLGLEAPAKAMLAAYPALHKTPGAHGIPLLSHAILGKSPTTFHLLLDAGADVNAAAFRGGTPLLAAIAADQTEMVRVLLAKGAERSDKALDLAKRRKVADIIAMLEKA